MNILILYYSGTGNTKFACEAARRVMVRAGHKVAMTTYAKAADMELAPYDIYCFAAPVYEWAPAKNVERFIKGMTSLPGKRVFILTSSAGATGQAVPLLARMLEDKGLVVLGDFNLLCPDSWGGTRRWSYAHDSESPTLQSVRELVAFTERMLALAADLEAGKEMPLPRYRVKPTGLFVASRLSRTAPTPAFKMGRKKVDESACTECGVCEKNCPAGAITCDPYPRFDRKCIACWRCINTCPADCITSLLDSNRHYKGIAGKQELLERCGL